MGFGWCFFTFPFRGVDNGSLGYASPRVVDCIGEDDLAFVGAFDAVGAEAELCTDAVLGPPDDEQVVFSVIFVDVGAFEEPFVSVLWPVDGGEV